MTNWNEINTEESIRLSQAEFKGMVVQALKDIQSDIAEIKEQNKVTRYISIVIAGISGIVSGIVGERTHL